MTPLIAENISIWLVDWSIVTITGNKMPPRDPDDDDADDADDPKMKTPRARWTRNRRSSENRTNSPQHLGQHARQSPAAKCKPQGKIRRDTGSIGCSLALADFCNSSG
jgi:hypothetical protein